MMSNTIKARKARVRRALERGGYRLQKSPRIVECDKYTGRRRWDGYRIIDCFGGKVRAGHDYTLSLEEAERWAQISD